MLKCLRLTIWKTEGLFWLTVWKPLVHCWQAYDVSEAWNDVGEENHSRCGGEEADGERIREEETGAKCNPKSRPMMYILRLSPTSCFHHYNNDVVKLWSHNYINPVMKLELSWPSHFQTLNKMSPFGGHTGFQPKLLLLLFFFLSCFLWGGRCFILESNC